MKLWQWEGKQTGLPRGYANQVLFYNADLFEKAGRKPPPAEWSGGSWEVGVVPKGKATRQTTGGGTGWAIPAETRNPDEAWPLLQHLLAPENQKIQAGFFYPSRKTIAEWFANADPQLPPKNRKTVYEAGNYSRTDPVHARWGDVDKIVQAELGPLLAGQVAAREAAQKIKRQVDAVLV
jgi:multiple sugar transport system substrate-binding protein